MKKRVCLLTGASGLLGTAFIARYSERYRILAIHHSAPLNCASQDQSLVDPLRPTASVPGNLHAVHAIRADLSDPVDIDRLVGTVIDVAGEVDLLVNAAAARMWSPLLGPDALAAAEASFRLNVVAPLRLSVVLVQRLWRERVEANIRANRNIVNISSTAGVFIYEDSGQALYAASKAALNHLTYHMASEFWDIGIRVNAVAPDTFPGRVATGDVVDAVAALDNSAQTGQIVALYPESGAVWQDTAPTINGQVPVRRRDAPVRRPE